MTPHHSTDEEEVSVVGAKREASGSKEACVGAHPVHISPATSSGDGHPARGWTGFLGELVVPFVECLSDAFGKFDGVQISLSETPATGNHEPAACGQQGHTEHHGQGDSQDRHSCDGGFDQVDLV